MSTSAAMAAIATTQAAVATAAADKARAAECRLLVREFDNSLATIEEKRSYASCIQRLYPEEIGASTIIALKVVFVIALLGAVVGVVISRRDAWNNWIHHSIAACFGFLMLPVVLIGIVSLFAGVYWLFT